MGIRDRTTLSDIQQKDYRHTDNRLPSYEKDGDGRVMTPGRRMIGTGTRLICLLGSPVAHSRSPAMHNAAFAELGLDMAYLAFDVGRENLRDAIVESHVVMDLNYSGGQTTILRCAADKGALTIDGREMLVQQAVRSFELWTDRAAPVKMMRERAENY